MAVTALPPHSSLVDHHDTIETDEESSYFRSVATAWLVGIPVMAALVAVLVAVVGDASIGGAVAVGLFAGFWIAPLAGVLGIGVWASKHHGPHG